jgi:hypothetical protein
MKNKKLKIFLIFAVVGFFLNIFYLISVFMGTLNNPILVVLLVFCVLFYFSGRNMRYIPDPDKVLAIPLSSVIGYSLPSLVLGFVNLDFYRVFISFIQIPLILILALFLVSLGNNHKNVKKNKSKGKHDHVSYSEKLTRAGIKTIVVLFGIVAVLYYIFMVGEAQAEMIFFLPFYFGIPITIVLFVIGSVIDLKNKKKK